MRAKQQPVRRANGTVRIDGVKDAYFCNTDHVPVWYESVGNYSWGKKNSGRRHVRTGGKEKDRFTAQLSVGKGGKKLIPFLILRVSLKPFVENDKCITHIYSHTVLVRSIGIEVLLQNQGGNVVTRRRSHMR